MDRAEIEKQREIGKQLMLVDIIHYENERVMKGAFFSVSKDELAKWASMEKEELGRLVNTCADLDPFNMACNVAHECASHNEEYKKDKNAYSFMLHSFRSHGEMILLLIGQVEISAYCEINAKENYESYKKKMEEFPVDEKYSKGSTLEGIMTLYILHFIKAVKDAVGQGYDWDVISRMLRFDISQERFQEIEMHFAGKESA